MKTIADHAERALDDALSMTFPASDPVAISIPDEPSRTPIERNPPLVARPRRGRREVSAPQDPMDP